MSVSQVTVKELKARLDAGEDLILLDVREPFELAAAAIPGAVSIPMGEIVSRAIELDSDRPVLVLCHHGIRSFQVAHWLRAHGFADVSNVRGGIDAWSLEVDPETPRYM